MKKHLKTPICFLALSLLAACSPVPVHENEHPLLSQSPLDWKSSSETVEHEYLEGFNFVLKSARNLEMEFETGESMVYLPNSINLDFIFDPPLKDYTDGLVRLKSSYSSTRSGSSENQTKAELLGSFPQDDPGQFFLIEDNEHLAVLYCNEDCSKAMLDAYVEVNGRHYLYSTYIENASEELLEAIIKKWTSFVENRQNCQALTQLDSEGNVAYTGFDCPL